MILRANDWVLNDEAMRNLGYMQMKKTACRTRFDGSRTPGGPRYNGNGSPDVVASYTCAAP